MATGLFWINALTAALGGFLVWFLGDRDGFLYTLVAFMAADFATGLMCAVRDRALSNKVGWAGIFRKAAIFLLVGVGHLLDTYVLRHDHIVRTSIIFFYLSNEGISLLENAVTLGLPVPETLRDILARLRDRDKPKKDGTFEGLESTEERRDDQDGL